MLQQLTLHTGSRMPVATDQRFTCRLVQTIGRLLGDQVLLFCVVDDHIHLTLQGETAVVRRQGSKLVRSLRQRSGLDLAPPHISPVEERRHLHSLIGYYARQTVRHGLPGHPAAWPGSCLADLVDVRATPGFDRLAIRRALPRLQVEAVLEVVALGREAVAPASDEVLFRAGPIGVRDAAMAAQCTVVGARTSLQHAANAAAAQLLTEADYGSRAIARALGVSQRAVRDMRSREVDGEVRQRIRRRVTFDRCVAVSPPLEPTARELEALRRSPFRGSRPHDPR